MSKKTTTKMGRRDFFRKAGLGAGAVGAAVVGLSVSNAQAAMPDKSAGKGAGYQETDHVKKYYELAKF